MKRKRKVVKSIETFTELIDMFGIKELSELLGVQYMLVQKMRFRNSIKVEYWPAIAEASKTSPLYGKEFRLEDIHALKSGRENHPGTSSRDMERAA